jgi:hypothetical protein
VSHAALGGFGQSGHAPTMRALGSRDESHPDDPANENPARRSGRGVGDDRVGRLNHGARDPISSDLRELGIDLQQREVAIEFLRGDSQRSGTAEHVQYMIADLTAEQHQPDCQFLTKTGYPRIDALAGQPPHGA